MSGARTNVLRVKPGDTVFVPAGIPHAVGEGILIVELQEPTDLSVLMEWANLDIDGRRDGHLGLGFDRALDSVDRSGWSKDRLSSLINQRSNESLLPPAADGFCVFMKTPVAERFVPQPVTAPRSPRTATITSCETRGARRWCETARWW